MLCVTDDGRSVEGPPARGLAQRRLASTFANLAGAQLLTAILGLAYWPISTHFFRPREVGIAAAATSTAALVTTVGVFGIATLLVAEIRGVRPSDQRTAISTGMLIAGGFALVLSVGTVGLAPALGNSVAAIGEDPLVALLFVVGTVTTVAASVFDNAALGLRGGPVRVIRPVLASSLKLLLVGAVIVTGLRSGAGLVLAWAAALLISLAVGWRMLGLDRTPRDRSGLQPRLDLVRRYRLLAFQHHVLNLSISSVSYALQVVAALLVLPTELAYFATAQIVSSVVGLVPYLFAFALFAEAANDEGLLRRLIRRTFPLGLLTCFLAVVVAELAAPEVLRLFGPEYAAHGTTVLRLLLLSALPYVVKDHYVAVRRAQGRLGSATRVLSLATIGEVGAGILGGVLWGLNGLALGWAAAATIEALFLLPAVAGVYRRASRVDAAMADNPN
jgi:O-antigen/teichoic acid export membrane protein